MNKGYLKKTHHFFKNVLWKKNYSFIRLSFFLSLTFILLFQNCSYVGNFSLHESNSLASLFDPSARHSGSGTGTTYDGKLTLHLINPPSSPHHDLSLNIGIGGNVTTIRYKWGPVASTHCSDPLNYSSGVSATLGIQDSLVGLPDGPSLICVVGGNDQGDFIPFTEAVSWTWIQDSMVFASIKEQDQSYFKNSSTATWTITLSQVKPYDVKIYFSTHGTALYGVDFHLIKNAQVKIPEQTPHLEGIITVPAGTQESKIQLSLVDNANAFQTPQNLYLHLWKSEATSVIFGKKSLARTLIKDPQTEDLKPQAMSLHSGPNASCFIDKHNRLFCWGDNKNGLFTQGDKTSLFINNPLQVNPGEHYKQVSLSNRHACGINLEDKLRCWGLNEGGVIGNGLITNNFTPPQTIDSQFKYQIVSVGDSHTCAITQDSDLKCWGVRYVAGCNSADCKISVPQVLHSGLKFKSLASYNGSSCALTLSGKLYCWGDNGAKRLGIPPDASHTVTRTSTPLPVDHETNYWKLAEGTEPCAITTKGQLKCWGNGIMSSTYSHNNAAPDIVDPSEFIPEQPSPVDMKESYQHFSTGSINCGITTTHKLRCWLKGSPSSKNLSLFDDTNSLDRETWDKARPHDITLSGENIVDVTTGPHHSCYLTDKNIIKCFGLIGDQPLKNTSPPPILERSDFTQVSLSSYSNICGLIKNGDRICWGRNSSGLLGDGSNLEKNTPTYITSPTPLQDLSLHSSGHACAIDKNQDLYCWGHNYSYQAGPRSTYKDTEVLKPRLIFQDKKFLSFSIYHNTTCAIDTQFSLWCFGEGSGKQFNDQALVANHPQHLDPTTKYLQVSINDRAICGITTHHQLKCWGTSVSGAIPTSTPFETSFISSPTVIDAATQYQSVSLSQYSGCALTMDQTMKCWGWAMLGLKIFNSRNDFSLPFAIDPKTKYKKVFTKDSTICGLDKDDQLRCLTKELSHFNISRYQKIEGSDFSIVNPGEKYRDMDFSFSYLCTINIKGQLQCWGSNLNSGNDLLGLRTTIFGFSEIIY